MGRLLNRLKNAKEIQKLDKSLEEVTAEFHKMRHDYLAVANSPIYNLICEYFLARTEINRELLEMLDPKIDSAKILRVQAEIKVAREFIKEVEEMKNLAIDSAKLDEDLHNEVSDEGF